MVIDFSGQGGVTTLHPEPAESPTTDESLLLAVLPQKTGLGNFLRAVAEAVLHILMESDVAGLLGPGRHEHSPEPLNYRNGDRDRTLDTRLGQLQLRIPKLCQGSSFAPFLEPRWVRETVLVAVIQGWAAQRIDGIAEVSTIDSRAVDPVTQGVGPLAPAGRRYRRAGPGPSAI